ncbi:trypsin-like peptidase domain-containing protein [Ideonella sp. YS5]|uniref:trypsin-like peptidase domain-containing protein n=1 Tax=Ideonella sp. YS5 TaxID=3453714 RepID=UPI003EEA08E4
MIVRTLLLTLALTGAAQAEPSYRYAGTATQQLHEVDANSIRKEGPWIYFDVRSRSLIPGSDYGYEGHIAVDCAARTRMDLSNTALFGGQRHTKVVDSPRMKTVFDGTQQAEEMDLVCGLAGAATAPTAASSMPAPPPPLAPAGRPKLRATTTGLVVSAEGWVLAPAEAVRDCGRVDVTALGAHHTAVLADGVSTGAGYAVLKIDGGPYPALLPRADPPPKGSPLTLLGFAADATATSQPRVAAAYVSGGEPADKPDGKPWITVSAAASMAVGVVLDERGLVAGVMQAQAGGSPGELKGSVARVESLRRLLDYHGVPWPAPAAQALPAKTDVLRRAVPATVLVACYTN